jgi:peptide/nickel transport system substrate-binding protein
MTMHRYASIGLLAALLVVTGLAGTVRAQRPPEGQLVLTSNFTIIPAYCDPAEAAQPIAAASCLYALHDALIKPLPGNPMAPALATAWTESPDGLVYDFTLREGVTFHNGDPFTAEDVKFSFERYKGIAAKQGLQALLAVFLR